MTYPQRTQGRKRGEKGGDGGRAQRSVTPWRVGGMLGVCGHGGASLGWVVQGESVAVPARATPRVAPTGIVTVVVNGGHGASVGLVWRGLRGP